jgi:hypothetical protein
MSEGQRSQPVIIVASTKSTGLAIILALFFGPLGLLYSSVLGAILMFIAYIAVIIVGVLTFGIGFFLLLFIHPICAVWAALAAISHNKKLLGGSYKQPTGDGSSTVASSEAGPTQGAFSGVRGTTIALLVAAFVVLAALGYWGVNRLPGKQKPVLSGGVPALVGGGGNTAPRNVRNIGHQPKLSSDHREPKADMGKTDSASKYVGLWQIDDTGNDFPNTLLKVTKKQNGRFQLVEKSYSPHAASKDSRIWLPPVDLDLVDGRLEGIYKNSNSRLTFESLSDGAMQYKIASEYGIRKWKAVRIKSDAQ